jgi:uncharacterized protein YggT (Ycf19 family)
MIHSIIGLAISVFIIGLFLYSKLLPHKDKLTGNYKGIFNFFNSIFTPLFNLLRPVFPPVQVGQGLSVDMTQIVVLIILLLLKSFFR